MHRPLWCETCLFLFSNTIDVSFPFPDGYTIEDIILSWENNEDGVQMTEELNIPQFNFLGKIITSKEVYFYTGGPGAFLLSCFLSLCTPINACGPPSLILTLSAASFPISLCLDVSGGPLIKSQQLTSANVERTQMHVARFTTLTHWKHVRALCSGPASHPPSTGSLEAPLVCNWA